MDTCDCKVHRKDVEKTWMVPKRSRMRVVDDANQVRDKCLSGVGGAVSDREPTTTLPAQADQRDDGARPSAGVGDGDITAPSHENPGLTSGRTWAMSCGLTRHSGRAAEEGHYSR